MLSPVTCVTRRCLLTSLTACVGVRPNAMTAYAAVQVPARWAPARQWMKTFSPPLVGLRHQRAEPLKVGQDGVATARGVKDAPGDRKAEPLWGIRLAVPGRGLDVVCAIHNEANPELLQALDVIGAHVATLVDTRLHAVRAPAYEDQVRCIVALTVKPTLAKRVVVAVRGTRLDHDMRCWNHEAAGAAVPAAEESLT